MDIPFNLTCSFSGQFYPLIRVQQSKPRPRCSGETIDDSRPRTAAELLMQMPEAGTPRGWHSSKTEAPLSFHLLIFISPVGFKF